jgi:signal transduction histidine kinase
VARLAAALERVRVELRASIARIEQARQMLETRVAERTQELAAANARLEDRERLRQELLRQVITAQEDERRRVARELHDETSQTLAALGIGVDLALANCERAGESLARERLLEVRGLVKRMHAELHRMIVNLRPSVLDDLGLAPAIRWFADRQLAAAGIAVRCELEELDELDARLPAELETAVFRAVQEALVNITRHAAADSVLIQGAVIDGRLLIEIEDDGVGFAPAGIVRSPDSLRGIGLLGMQERIEILGGSLEIDSTPGEGTRIVFSVPLHERTVDLARVEAAR